MDLFDFLVADTPPICEHRFTVGKNGSGWTLEHDTESPFFGKWVDSNPNCRRPGHHATNTPEVPNVGLSEVRI